jgi:type VI secretion system protein ImpB
VSELGGVIRGITTLSPVSDSPSHGDRREGFTMADESKQHWLDRNRPPRVQITYDVETGGAAEKKELPMVVGILSDLSGTSKAPLPKLKDRKFVEIDRDNFNTVLAAIKPEVSVTVADRIKGGDSVRKVDLVFSHINDFTPERIVDMYQPLKDLLDARTRLNDLLGKLEGNDELSLVLKQILEGDAQMKAIQDAVKKEQEAAAAAADAENP